MNRLVGVKTLEAMGGEVEAVESGQNAQAIEATICSRAAMTWC